MMFKTAAAATVVLAVTAGFAQGASPVPVPGGTPHMSQRQSPAGRSTVSPVPGSKATGVLAPATLRERVQDMESTLIKMHAVLKQMRAKAASSSTDPLAKANVDMWELLVGHLDKQLRELQVAMMTREDMEARRAAMYKQAEAKSEAAAQAARNPDASKTPTPAPAAQGAGQGAAGQNPAGTGETRTPPANDSPSPN